MSSKLSREEFRRQKDLDAARKAGTAAPAVDEDGVAINPHIPEFMSKAPWYLKTTDEPSLKHQKINYHYNDDVNKLKSRFTRGIQGERASTYRKGACENCGAMTHKTRDCLERPRKKGAKYTGRDIAPDEIIHDASAHLNGREGQGDYDAKRDRWDGYDPAMHANVVAEYDALEAARRAAREAEIDGPHATRAARTRLPADPDFGSDDDDDAADAAGSDEDKYAEAADMSGQHHDKKARMTVRDLRIREDTAKYLLNLDPRSAYYDPKTRSMRDAPRTDIAPEDAVFAGDNFARASGEAREHQRLQLFALQAEQRGNQVHPLSNPTASLLLSKEFAEKRADLKEATSSSILAKYGGAEYLAAPPRELLTGQTESYVEYSRTGAVVRGHERAKARSKYEEDVYPGNHTSVWGSYYDVRGGQWGYACCHSCVKRSYCAGEAGKEAAAAAVITAAEAAAGSAAAGAAASAAAVAAAAAADAAGVSGDDSDTHGKELSHRKESHGKESSHKRRLPSTHSPPPHKRAHVGDGDVDARLDKDKLARALRGDGQSYVGKDVTEEDMEAYRMQRQLYEDPLASLPEGELLEYKK